MIERIKSLLPQQYKDASNLNKLLEVIVSPFNELKDVFVDIKNLLDIENNSGVQLDLIGEIVVQKRNGLNDADYRKLLRFKIKKNTSKATVEDIVSILKFLTNGTRVVYSDNPPAAYTIYTNGQTIPPNLRLEIDKISAAGVSVIVYGSVDGSKPIIFYDELNTLIEKNLTDDLGNNITDENLDELMVLVPNDGAGQILLTFEDGEFILDENGNFIADENFSQTTLIESVSSYDLFDGVRLGALETVDLTDDLGNIFMTDTGATLQITTDNIISEGKLVLAL